MASYHRLGAPVTICAAAELDDGLRIAFIDFPGSTNKRQLAELPYLTADGGSLEVADAFKAAMATTDQKTKLKLLTEFSEMEARHTRRLAEEEE